MLFRSHEIGLHTQFIGEIIDVKADEEILNEKGFPRMNKVAPFVFGHGIREYWALGESIGRGFDIGRKYSK